MDGGPNNSKLLAVDIFEGGKRKGKKETKDYHGMFDHDYFVAWMARLLDELDALGIRNSIITMDNAAYHKCLPDNTPRQRWKKLQASRSISKLWNHVRNK